MARRGSRADKAVKVRHNAPTSGNIQIDGAEKDNVYAEAVDAGHRVDERTQKIFVMVVIMLAVVAVGLFIPDDMLNSALHAGGINHGYSFAWFTDDLMSNVGSATAFFTGHWEEGARFGNRLALYIVICATGAGLAICGAVYQGAFKNALVSPSTLGVMSGSTLGIMIWVVFYVADDGSNVSWVEGYKEAASIGQYLLNTYSLSIISFAGCILVVSLVLFTMRVGRRNKTSGMSPIMMIIAGQCIGSVLGAVSGSIRYYYLALDPYGVKTELLRELAISSFYRNYTIIDIVAIGIPLALVVVVVMRLRHRMTILTFSADEARTLGVDTRRMQYALVAVCTLLTAILISFCGHIGFVGFLVPHMARRLVGPDFGHLLPAAAFMGGAFVAAAYMLVMSTLGPEYDNMVGMFISIFGSAVFLVTALSGKGGARGEFK